MFHLHPDIHVRLRDLDRIGHLAVLLEQVPGVVILFLRLAFHRLVLQMIYANLKASLNLRLQRFLLKRKDGCAVRGHDFISFPSVDSLGGSRLLFSCSEISQSKEL